MRPHTSRPSIRPWMLALAILPCALSGTAYGWSVSGTVRNNSGATLSGVVVTVKDSASFHTTTSATGTFSLASLPVGVDRSSTIPMSSVRLVDGALVLEGMNDGPIDLALVNASGRSLWSAKVHAVQGAAQANLPAGLGRGAIFLRLSDAQGTRHHAVSAGASGIQVAPMAAGRTLAGEPVLQFSLTGYRDTTYAMTSLTQTNVNVVMTPVVTATCPLPTTFRWKDYGGPLAQPKNNMASIKDFTMVTYNGKKIIYMTTHDKGTSWGGAMMAPITNWSEAANAAQTKTTGLVAPELIYFAPKNIWVMTYQWCGAGKFCYLTSSDPTNPNSWANSKGLLTEDITRVGNPSAGNKASDTGPIDNVVICDDGNCYLFYADDMGRIYRASMPIGNFPGTFSGSKVILQDTQARLFEAVEVYKLKGQDKYLMIVEAMGSGGRYFRAFTATGLGGTWTALSGADTEATPFAGKRNVTFTNDWSNDISHGDIVRSHDQTRTIDPCNLEMLYQGYKPPFSGDYGLIPYTLGLITLQK